MLILGGILFFLLIAFVSVGQFNPETNGFDPMMTTASPSGRSADAGCKSLSSGIACNENSFWAIGGGQIVSFTLNGHTIVNTGSNKEKTQLIKPCDFTIRVFVS